MTGAAATRGLATAVPSGPTFDHGVASGDPTADAVVLWTRVTGGGDGDLAVHWTVARDAALSDVVAEGEALARVEADRTVHVDVGGLGAGATWFYGFEAGGVRSPVGRTRTARGPDDDGEVRLGVASCASYAAGPFTAYGHLAEADVDLVVHLGDYLYDAGRGVRRHDPPEDPVSLDDYRRRHAQQRSDPDLQRLHAQLPMAAVWDDHEVAGNAWRGGAPGHDPAVDGPWEARRTAAVRAWLEWLPIRRPDLGDDDRIWRSLPLGGVADLFLLDTRHDGRDEQVSAGDGDGAAALASPERRLLSTSQESWLAGSLSASTASWRVLGNQVVLTPLAFEVPSALASPTSSLGVTIDGKVVNPDAWDGYPAARERLLDAVAAAGPTVVLTGDVHSSWAFEVPGRDGTPTTVEWVTPSITAEPFSEIVGIPTPALAPAAVDLIAGQLAQVRWAELTRHGFLVVSLTPDEARCDWWHVDLDEGGAEVAASWSTPSGTNRLVQGQPLGVRPAASPPTSPPPAPPSTSTTMRGEREGGGGPLKSTLTGAAAGGAIGAAALAGVLTLRRRRRR